MPIVRMPRVPLYQQGFTDRLRVLAGLGQEDFAVADGGNGGGNGGGGGDGGSGGDMAPPDVGGDVIPGGGEPFDFGGTLQTGQDLIDAGVSGDDFALWQEAGSPPLTPDEIAGLAAGDVSMSDLLGFTQTAGPLPPGASPGQPKKTAGGGPSAGAPSGGSAGGGKPSTPQQPKLPPGPAPRVSTQPQASVTDWLKQQSVIKGVPNWVFPVGLAALLLFSGGSDASVYSRPPRRRAL